jgi:hypothetical protein
MRDHDMARSSLLGQMVVFLFALSVLILGWAAPSLAQGQVGGPTPPPAPPTASPSDEILRNWRNGMAQVPAPNTASPNPAAPNRGCFASTYPDTHWQQVPCVAGPRLHFPPARGPRAATVGNGNDPVPGVTTGHISSATGSFDSVSGVTSVTSEFGADDYSLQLNTNVFSAPICSSAGTPGNCVGWQQFVYTNNGCTTNLNTQIPCAFMQYWLIGWGSTTCPPGGWTFFNNGGDDECYMSTDAIVPPQQPIANLGNLSIVAQAVSGGSDTVIFSSGNNLYLVQNADSVLGVAGGWTAAEYNLVGDCCGSAATLNSGSSMVVRISVDNGSRIAPTCVSASFEGYTAETNNLNFQPPSGTPRSSTQPAIVFTQSSNASVTAPCAAAVAVPAASKLADTHDSNGDGFSDLVWADSGGDVAVWLMSAGQVKLSGSPGSAPGWTLLGQRDFNGDGTYDLLWRDGSGNTSIWFMIGTQVFSSLPGGNIPNSWGLAGVADFNGDGKGDLLWRDGTGNTVVWLMNGASVLQMGSLGNIPNNWSVAGTGDFDGNGNADILWRDGSGNTAIWFMNGVTIANSAAVGLIGGTWAVIGTGDFNADGKTDIVWRDGSGNTSIWLMNGTSVLPASGGIGTVGLNWSLAVTGDYNGDGKSDLLWRDGTGNTAIWFMNGASFSSAQSLGNIANTWTLQRTNAE